MKNIPLQEQVFILTFTQIKVEVKFYRQVSDLENILSEIKMF